MTLISIPIWPHIHSITMHSSIFPISFINSSISPFKYTPPIKIVTIKHSLIDISLRVNIFSDSVFSSVCYLPLVPSTWFPLLNTVTVRNISLPLTWIFVSNSLVIKYSVPLCDIILNFTLIIWSVWINIPTFSKSMPILKCSNI